MGTIAILGERHRIDALSLAGAEPLAAETPEAVVDAWSKLSVELSVLILTRSAASALGDRVVERRDLLITVLP